MATESTRPSLRSSSSTSHVCTSIPETYNYPLQNSRTQDVFQSIVKGRKSWKTLRGGEIVWPPELEAALLEGLESYQPNDSRETRLLGRFPMRNRFISDHIFRRTGKRRTAKQVGSRLQQLRDTCGGKKLLNLLSPRRPFGPGPSRAYNSHHLGSSCGQPPQSDSDSSSDTSSPPATPTDISTHLHGSDATTGSRAVVYIDILPEHNSGGSDCFPTLDRTEWSYSGGVLVSQYPRPIRSIDPTVTLMSYSSISAQSHFTVHSAGRLVFSEAVSLTLVGPAPESIEGALLYSTTLVPGFWDKITGSDDPTQYTIVQEVIQDGPTSPSITFSAVYQFKYPSGNPDHIHSPSVSDSSDKEAKIAYNLQNAFDCLLPMDGPLPDCEVVEPYYDFSSVEIKPMWTVRSPSEFSTELSSVYDHSHSSGEHDEDLDPLLSPISVCFPTSFSNYVS